MFSLFEKKVNDTDKTTEIIVSEQLVELYIKLHKNYDYAINQALDSFDPESYIESFRIIETFKIKGEPAVIKIGNSVVEKIKTDLEIEELEDTTVELLLWIGAIFPEV